MDEAQDSSCTRLQLGFPIKKRRPVSELVHGICSSAVNTWLIVPCILNPYSKSLAAPTADNRQLEEQLCLNRFSAKNQLPASWLLIFSIRADGVHMSLCRVGNCLEQGSSCNAADPQLVWGRWWSRRLEALCVSAIFPYP